MSTSGYFAKTKSCCGSLAATKGKVTVVKGILVTPSAGMAALPAGMAALPAGMVAKTAVGAKAGVVAKVGAGLTVAEVAGRISGAGKGLSAGGSLLLDGAKVVAKSALAPSALVPSVGVATTAGVAAQVGAGLSVAEVAGRISGAGKGLSTGGSLLLDGVRSVAKSAISPSPGVAATTGVATKVGAVAKVGVGSTFTGVAGQMSGAGKGLGAGGAFLLDGARSAVKGILTPFAGGATGTVSATGVAPATGAGGILADVAGQISGAGKGLATGGGSVFAGVKSMAVGASGMVGKGVSVGLGSLGPWLPFVIAAGLVGAVVVYSNGTPKGRQQPPRSSPPPPPPVSSPPRPPGPQTPSSPQKAANFIYNRKAWTQETVPTPPAPKAPVSVPRKAPLPREAQAPSTSLTTASQPQGLWEVVSGVFKGKPVAPPKPQAPTLEAEAVPARAVAVIPGIPAPVVKSAATHPDDFWGDEVATVPRDEIEDTRDVVVAVPVRAAAWVTREPAESTAKSAQAVAVVPVIPGIPTPVVKSAATHPPAESAAKPAQAVAVISAISGILAIPGIPAPVVKSAATHPDDFWGDEVVTVPRDEIEDVADVVAAEERTHPREVNADFDEIISKTKESLDGSIANLMARQRDLGAATDITDPTIEARRRELLAEMEASITAQKNIILNKILMWAEDEKARLEEWTDREYKAEMGILRRKFNDRIDSEFNVISEYFASLAATIEHAAEAETKKLQEENASTSDDVFDS